MTTTISVSDDTKARFDDLKAALDERQDAPNHTNESFLSALLDTWEAADAGYYEDDAMPDIDDVLAEFDGSQLDYDDVVQACRQAIREELPVGEMGR